MKWADPVVTGNVNNGAILTTGELKAVTTAPFALLSTNVRSCKDKNDVLTIEGSRASTSEIDENNYYRKEVRTGSFHRALVLPVSVQSDKAQASFENGLLKVTLPKEERSKSKNIKINIQSNKNN